MWPGTTSFTCCTAYQTAQDYCRSASNINYTEGKVTLELVRVPGPEDHEGEDTIVQKVPTWRKNYLYESQKDYRTPGSAEEGNYSPPPNWSCKDECLITHIHCMYVLAGCTVVSGLTFRSISMDLQPCKGKVPCDVRPVSAASAYMQC